MFAWLKAEGFTLTKNGFIVAYKGVTASLESVHIGAEPVTVETADGNSSVVTGRIPYPVGATVSMPRKYINPSRDAYCSVGIHVGTHSYANTIGSKIILVLIDPKDVVAVPRDWNGQKMRVSKLKVLKVLTDGKIVDAVMTVPDDTARKRYNDRDGNRKRVSVSSTALVPAPTANIAKEVAPVADAILEKVANGGLTKRALVKRFSKNRRVHVDTALAALTADKRVKIVDGNLYVKA